MQRLQEGERVEVEVVAERPPAFWVKMPNGMDGYVRGPRRHDSSHAGSTPAASTAAASAGATGAAEGVRGAEDAAEDSRSSSSSGAVEDAAAIGAAVRVGDRLQMWVAGVDEELGAVRLRLTPPPGEL
jgi:hypothetical protein